MVEPLTAFVTPTAYGDRSPGVPRQHDCGARFFVVYFAIMQNGDCVKNPDGRIGRIRDIKSEKVRVRVMRATSHTHQFLWFGKYQLKVVRGVLQDG